MSSGRPVPEVIMSFQDGGYYSQQMMQQAAAKGVFDKTTKPKAKPIEDVKLKKEDVDLVVKEFEISRQAAEKALREHGGKIMETLEALATP